MSLPILGLHHVTATVDDAQADLDFSVATLGLRLVKKTVNFDNHRVYHFYYGSEVGNPGTIWTTFPYKGMGVATGVKGTGQVTATSFSVPASSLPFWKSRFEERGFTVRLAVPRFGNDVLEIIDPSGLSIDLVATDADDRKPWISSSGEPTERVAIRGLHSVTMTHRDPKPTIEFMRRLLGYEVIHEENDRTRIGVNGSGAGRIIDILHNPEASAARNGMGTVHHVAMAIEEPKDQLRLKSKLEAMNVSVTPVMDRQYFQSIYFREPGGVLFEVATIKPGFTVDESIGELGRSLKLPPEAELRRGEIEASLPPLKYR